MSVIWIINELIQLLLLFRYHRQVYTYAYMIYFPVPEQHNRNNLNQKNGAYG